MSGIGQDVNAALGAFEPSIDIVQQNLGRVRNRRREIANTAAASRQRAGAGQRLLAIRRHDRGAGAASYGRVALSALMLGDEPGTLFWVPPRARGGRLDDPLHLAGVGDREHAEPEPPTKITISGVALPSLAARGQFAGKPNLVARAGAIHGLQHQLQIERKLQLTDDDNRGLVAAQSNEIASPDLTFDGEPEIFKEPFDREVKCGFQKWLPCCPCDSLDPV